MYDLSFGYSIRGRLTVIFTLSSFPGLGGVEPRSEGGRPSSAAVHPGDVQPLLLHRRLLRRAAVLHEKVPGVLTRLK